MSGNFNLPSDYNDVASRLVEFREKHPEGSLQQVRLEFVQVAGSDWAVFTAAAFRTADDPRPGMGTAWEPVPGRTPFTRDSEVQNAETAAWGRAIVATLAADTKKGIASAEEIRNRNAEQLPPTAAEIRAGIKRAGEARGMTVDAIADDFAGWSQGATLRDAEVELLSRYRDRLEGGAL